jgi:hypothetical protein
MSPDLAELTHVYSMPEHEVDEACVVRVDLPDYEELLTSQPRRIHLAGIAVPVLIGMLHMGTGSVGATGTFTGATPSIFSADQAFTSAAPVPARATLVRYSPAPATLPQDDRVADELEAIRSLTGLPVHDIARLCGLQRRQVYNLLDGLETEPRRAAAVREVARSLAVLAERLGSQAALRSAILAPLDAQGRTFLDLASRQSAGSVARAAAALDAYLDRLGGARPPLRVASARRQDRAEAVRLLREMHGDDTPAADH